ncbi:RNA methylase family protein [Blumeria hordei DH14]|uniref:Trimethylguanosine synthase n=1 Tax=Blumeria graminis f. sp. hordei (strain DH14) TaxID=546991 RepID=N1J955_BLUG1|nr:RNA methylase family protein [Blumeria hordei DH14]
MEVKAQRSVHPQAALECYANKSIDTNGTEEDDPPESAFALTLDCHHYTSLNQVAWDIQKYWQQRHQIFSRYDEGIRMTDDAWFGVTPEPVAQQVAQDLASNRRPEQCTLIDMFAGAGGNVIAFARTQCWSRIIAIEKDAAVLACAYHNAKIYGVQDCITWVHADAFDYLSHSAHTLNANEIVIFASPPWGGPSYRCDAIFDLNTMQPYSLLQIYEVTKHVDTAIYLPRTSDLRQIACLGPKTRKIEVVQYCMQGASKAMVAFIPAVQ